MSVKGTVTRTPFKGVLWQYFLFEKNMPELICPNCGAKFEYKKTDDR